MLCCECITASWLLSTAVTLTLLIATAEQLPVLLVGGSAAGDAGHLEVVPEGFLLSQVGIDDADCRESDDDSDDDQRVQPGRVLRRDDADSRCVLSVVRTQR